MRLEAEITGKFEEPGDCARLLYVPPPGVDAIGVLFGQTCWTKGFWKSILSQDVPAFPLTIDSNTDCKYWKELLLILLCF